MRNTHTVVNLLILTFLVSCGDKKTNSNFEANNKGSTPITVEDESFSELPVIGTSFTKKIIIKTNKQKELLQDIAFDKDKYLFIVEKITQERAKLSENEFKKNFRLKSNSNATNSILASAGIMSGSTVSFVSPLKLMRHDAINSAISTTVEKNDIQIGKLISLLAQYPGEDLVRPISDFKNTPDQMNQIKNKLIKKAQEKMTSRDVELFSSQLKEEYLVNSLTFAKKNLENANTSNSNIESKLNEATNNLLGTKLKVDELAYNLKSFVENNSIFLNEQHELLKMINSNIVQNNASLSTSLIKLDFFTQMTFGSMPAVLQLDHLKNANHLIPLSEQERNKLKSSLEFKVKTEKAIQLIATSDAFILDNSLGYIDGISSITSILSKNNGFDQRFHMILQDQSKTLLALKNLNDQINNLRTEINKSFKSINVFGNTTKNDLNGCQLISKEFNTPTSYLQIKKELSKEDKVIRLSECLNNLTKFFTKPDYNEENMSFTTNLSYKKNNLESTLINSYSHIYEALENENSKDVKNFKFNLKTILNPDLLNDYVVELLNNHHWYDITERSQAGWNLVKAEDLRKNIEENKTSVVLLKNALLLVEANLYQHRIWSGVSSLDFFYEEYITINEENSKKVNCSSDPTNVICISIENPWFFNNLINHVIQKNMPNDYFFAAKLIAPNDPDYFNENMVGAFKFVWIGEGADPLYSGEVITDPKMINIFGNGMLVKIETADKTNFYPVPLEYYLKKKTSYDMPKTNLLLKLKRIIQDEILDLNLKSILNESEHNQTLLFQ